MSDANPTWRIAGEYEKGKQDRIHPMAPEFAELLLTVPADQRQGPLFDLRGDRGKRLKADRVSRTIAKIGKAAEVIVNGDRQTGQDNFASVHDLRRSYGARWATRLLPQQLRELMRHESIETTLRFYVGEDAERTADILWNAYRT